MKKKFFLVGALVAMSMSTMFIACSKNDQNTPSDGSDGCNCTIRESDGSQSREYFSKMDMAEVGATTCGELSSAIRGMYGSHGMNVTVLCE